MHPYFNAFLVALCDVHKVMKNTEAKIHQIINKKPNIFNSYKCRLYVAVQERKSELRLLSIRGIQIFCKVMLNEESKWFGRENCVTFNDVLPSIAVVWLTKNFKNTAKNLIFVH